MFSVVIPLYNKEGQIRKTLDSVLNQTFTDFEVIIVNDGSKDKSAEVVESIDDSRIRLINQENAGVSAARNKGIKEAKNEWIAFLDADDLWKPNKLEEVAKAINENEDISWLVTGLETVKGTQRKEFVYKKSGFLEDALDDLFKGLYIQTSSVVVKKSIFIQNSNLLFRVGINNSEDREVWYKLMLLYPKLFYVNKVLAIYIRDTTGTSLTSRDNIKPHFLNLANRITSEINSVENIRMDKLLDYIKDFNRKAILNIWVVYGWFDFFQEELNVNEYRILKYCENFPLIVKKTIVKIFL